MTVVNFPNLEQIVAFDGTVLEIFYGYQSRRIHAAHLKNMQVTTDRKGNLTLHIVTIASEIPYLSFDNQLLDKVNALVAEVQAAMSSFKV